MSETRPLNYLSPEPESPPPKSALWIILFIVFLDLMGFGIILPQLPFYAIHYHVSPVQVTLLFSIYSVCQFLAAPMLGIISDKYGRRPCSFFRNWAAQSATRFWVLLRSCVSKM